MRFLVTHIRAVDRATPSPLVFILKVVKVVCFDAHNLRSVYHRLLFFQIRRALDLILATVLPMAWVSFPGARRSRYSRRASVKRAMRERFVRRAKWSFFCNISSGMGTWIVVFPRAYGKLDWFPSLLRTLRDRNRGRIRSCDAGAGEKAAGGQELGVEKGGTGCAAEQVVREQG
jgi:hypothetical protein